MSENQGIVEVEADEDGSLLLTSSVLGAIQPHDRFHVELQRDGILLRRTPKDDVPPKADSTWRTETPMERVAAFEAHVRRYATNAGLSDAAVSRESIYD